jgi:T5SS/PEP-CTERM-associated repeat protein
MPLPSCRPSIILTLFLTLALPSAHAQSATSRTTNLFSRTTTEWSGDFFVGSNTSHHVLNINDAAVLSNDKAFVGYSQESANNQVILSGKGSRWNCADCAVIGYRGGGNSLLIANGATLSSGSSTSGRKTPEPRWDHAWVGFWSEGNTALVTGQDSVWIAKGLCIGEWGKRNSLRIGQGGAVFSQEAWIGRDPNANDNQVTVTGNHSLWRNSGSISVGKYGLNCSLDILDNATVVAGNVAVGEFLDTLGQSTPLGHSVVATGSRVQFESIIG